MKFIIQIATAFALMVPLAASAHDNMAGKVGFEHPWARITMLSRPAAGFVTVHNKSDHADRIVAARSPLADRVELHTHLMDDGVMRMRPVEAIDVPASGQVSLKPGGLHLMVFGLKKMLKKGEVLPITLVFEHAGEIDVEFTVGGAAGGMDHGMSGGMDHGKSGGMEHDKTN